MVKRMVLEHNHPCQSGHFHFYPQIQFAVNADENLVMLDLVSQPLPLPLPLPLSFRFCFHSAR